MPELPEVETTRRFIAPVLGGATIERAEVRRDRTARRNARPVDVSERLRGRSIGDVGRRGKFILADVEGDLTLVLHLGMSGRMQIAVPGEPEAPHTNALLATHAGVELRFVDPRTFGFIAVFTPEELESSGLDRIGRDALDDLPSTDDFVAHYADRVPVIKAALLDQRFVAGLGNIYADEVLHVAGVHPATPIGTLTRSQIEHIRNAIAPVLQAGIRHGGTSLDDMGYLLPDGRAGEYLSRLGVYGRQGEACHRCGSLIERHVIAQRSSHFCPNCQALQG